jgi:hypothetical protein
LLVAVFLKQQKMSEIEVTTGTWLGGMPTFDYKIKINGIAISLTKDDFLALTKSIDKTISENLQKALEVKEKYDNNVKKVQELRKDIINVFWRNDGDGDDWFIRKEVKDIDEDKLVEVLEKYNRFLGFE